MALFAVYHRSTENGDRYWGVHANANGDYYMTQRGYANPVTALRQIVSGRNKAYAGQRQHINSWLHAHGMLHSKINSNTLKALVRMNDPNLYNRMLAAQTLSRMGLKKV